MASAKANAVALHMESIRDVIGADTGPKPSGRDEVDGSIDIVDRDRTEANEAPVAEFIQVRLVERRLDRITDFIDVDRHLQHNSEVGA